MLIIFDVDGTLIGGEEEDWRSFEEAFLHVTGSSFPENFFCRIEEITAQAIVHQALPDFSPEARHVIEKDVRDEHLLRLHAAHAFDNKAFLPKTGAAELLDYLDCQEDLSVAIATGDWHETISFKLEAAGIDVSRFPMATSSDCYSRADIIRLAAERAGYPLKNTLYVGDGLWDFRATRQLGIPFLGVGHRYKELCDGGVVHALQTLEPSGFVQWFGRFRRNASDILAT